MKKEFNSWNKKDEFYHKVSLNIDGHKVAVTVVFQTDPVPLDILEIKLQALEMSLQSCIDDEIWETDDVPGQ